MVVSEAQLDGFGSGAVVGTVLIVGHECVVQVASQGCGSRLPEDLVTGQAAVVEVSERLVDDVVEAGMVGGVPPDVGASSVACGEFALLSEEALKHGVDDRSAVACIDLDEICRSFVDPDAQARALAGSGEGTLHTSRCGSRTSADRRCATVGHRVAPSLELVVAAKRPTEAHLPAGCECRKDRGQPVVGGRRVGCGSPGEEVQVEVGG